MSDTSLVFNAVGRDRGVSKLLENTASNVHAANLRSAASTVAMGAAMGSAASYAVALGSSALQAVGAIGLMPAAIAGLAATVIAGKVVTSGLGEAWKATGDKATTGGGRAVDVAKRVAMAQRGVQSATQALADAQRTARETQEAITRARIDEAERLSDLTRSLAGARLDEESAVRAVAQAKQELEDAQNDGFGDTERIAAADLAYRQSVQTLDEVRDRVDDLGKEQADGTKKGVEGSDAVQQALRRQEESQRAVTEAAQRLADAQNAVQEASAAAAAAGVDPAAEALAKLAPSARAVVLTLRALGPAWQAAGRAAQQATFKGVAGDLRQLSDIYLPTTTSWLKRMGGSFNVAIRESLGLFKTKSAASDVGRILDATALTVDKLARAVKPVINGLLQWAAVGAGFLPGFAGEVGNVAQRFERWSIASRESGRMQQWIGNAVGVLRQLWAIARDVGASILAIFRAGDDGGSTLDSLERGAAILRRWTESAQGQEKLKAIFTSLRDIIGGIAGAFSNADAPAQTFTDGLNVAGPVLKFAADNTDLLAKALPWLAAGLLAAKAAQIGANVAKIVSLPLIAAQTAANWRLGTALKSTRTALVQTTAANGAGAIASGANTAATTAGDVAAKRSLISLAAQKVAMVGARVATLAYAAGQWILNAALAANPIGLIIIAVIALIAGIVLLWQNSETFRKIVTDVWQAVWGAIKAAFDWISKNWRTLFDILTWPHRTAWKALVWVWDQIRAVVAAGFNNVVDGGAAVLRWFTDLPGRIGRALRTVGEFLTAPFRAAFNGIAYLWNRTLGNFSFTVPDWIPGVGGHSFALPQLPYLASGGTVTRAGLAVVGEEGPEVVQLGAGASVVPLSRGASSPAAGGRGGELRVIVVGGDRDAVAYFRRLMGQRGLGVA